MADKRHRVPLDLDALSGREDLWHFSQAVQRAPAVDDWLNGEPAQLRSIARTWFTHMRQCGDDVRELLNDGCPVACVEDSPFGYVNTFKQHVNVGFFHGAALEDPAALLEGSGKHMRHVKIRPGREPSTDALCELIDAAYADVKARIAAERADVMDGRAQR